MSTIGASVITDKELTYKIDSSGIWPEITNYSGNMKT